MRKDPRFPDPSSNWKNGTYDVVNFKGELWFRPKRGKPIEGAPISQAEFDDMFSEGAVQAEFRLWIRHIAERPCTCTDTRKCRSCQARSILDAKFQLMEPKTKKRQEGEA